MKCKKLALRVLSTAAVLSIVSSIAAPAFADVYDALTSERCYKKAFPHETAVQMITNGECGAFNPLLLQCLLDVQGELKQEILQW